MGLYIDDENIRKQIDKLLHKVAKVEGNLGADSTKRQWTTARAKQCEYFEKIKLLDEEFYNVICP